MKNYYLLELVFFSFLFPLATKHVHCTPIVNANLQGITHKLVQTNGIEIHVADKGEGPVILFLHGYPQLWYTWRHQIQSLSSRGYRTLAPDLRGYGDSDAPSNANNYSSFHVVGDLIGMLDILKIDQVLLVAHDWGAIIAWYMSMFRPDRIKAMVILSVPFNPRQIEKPIARWRRLLGDDFYICRFQEPGVVEAEYARADLPTLFKKILTNREPGPHMVPKSVGFGAVPKTPIALPSWLTEEDIKYYATKYNHTGFTGPLNYYRNLDIDWELTAPWPSESSKVKVPVKFITGDLDMTYTIPGVKQFVQNNMIRFVPNLQETVVMKGVGHFIQEEKANEISDHIFSFFQKF